MPLSRIDQLSISTLYESQILGRLNNYYANKKTVVNFFKGEIIRRIAAIALPVLKTLDLFFDLSMALALKTICRIQKCKCFKDSTFFSFMPPGELRTLGDSYLKKSAVDFKDIFLSLPREMIKSSYEVPEPFNYKFNSDAVRIRYSPGRTGDCLLAYLKAKWIAYKKGVPMLFEPFKGSEKFKLHDNETYRFDMGSAVQKFDYQETYTTETEGNQVDGLNLYTVNYHPEDPNEFNRFPENWEITVDWDDPKFQAIVEENLKPTGNVNLVDIPKCDASIALHVRQGQGFDADAFSYVFPLKLPPLDYYLEALTQTCQEYQDSGKKNLYIHLFTDNPNPAELKEEFSKIKNQFPNLNIQIGFRNDAGMLDDLFSMTKFDALIRSTSNFSLISGVLGRPEKEFFPSAFNYDTEFGQVLFTGMKTRYRSEKGKEVSQVKNNPLNIVLQVPEKLQKMVEKLI